MSDLPVPAIDQRPAKVTEDEAVAALRALLAHPAMAQDVGLNVLARMALDDKIPPREKRRCAEVLAHLKLKAVEVAAHVTGAREQHLRALGISSGPQEVNVTQHNTKIEIIREGARDWRTAESG